MDVFPEHTLLHECTSLLYDVVSTFKKLVLLKNVAISVVYKEPFFKKAEISVTICKSFWGKCEYEFKMCTMQAIFLYQGIF